MIPAALFLATWAYQAVRPLVARRRVGRHELAPPAPSARPDPRRATVTTVAEGWAAHSARLAEKLDACRVRCHVCGTRVYVGETAHDVEPVGDGVERFACAEHCETCR
jgi:uncharacterized protein (DUF58 family)